MASMRSCLGLDKKFSLLCRVALSSISMAVMYALLRCAAIKAITPHPVPISRIVSAALTSAHAPRSTPSVPTFIAHLLSSTLNCLNRKGFRVLIQDKVRLILRVQKYTGSYSHDLLPE